MNTTTLHRTTVLNKNGKLIVSFLVLLLLSILNMDLHGDNFISGSKIIEENVLLRR